VGFAVFNGLRTTIHQIGIPVSYAYPIDIDGRAFGEVPTLWLQDHFFTLGHYRTHDWIAVAVYTSYFTAHFLLGGLIWFFRRDFLGSYVRLILAVFFVGLIGYLLIPTSPPWLASETAHLPEVFRIMKLATSQVWADAYSQGAYVAGTNDVAAMPSLHTALTTAVALTLWRVNRIAGISGWLYVAAMGLSLFYLGEHYVTDVVAGIAMTCVLWRLLMHQTQADDVGEKAVVADKLGGVDTGVARL
jgi:membrane-associated phospholipid phosphatase